MWSNFLLVPHQPLGYFPQNRNRGQWVLCWFHIRRMFHHPHIPICRLMCTLWGEWSHWPLHLIIVVLRTIQRHVYPSCPLRNSSTAWLLFTKVVFSFHLVLESRMEFLVCIFHYELSNMEQKGFSLTSLFKIRKLKAWAAARKQKGEDSNIVLPLVCNIWQELTLV